jgi:tetratricopeptide (TPR) repeat protein
VGLYWRSNRLSIEDPKNWKALCGAGLMLQRMGEHSKAVETFSKVISLQPRIAEAYYSRALSFADLELHERALEDLGIAWQLDPEDADILYARGFSLKNLKRYDEALEAVSAAISKREQFPEAYEMRASLRSLRGDNAGAVADFRTCLAQGHDRYGVRLLRGIAFFRLGQYADAIADLSIAISMSPEIGSTYLRRWQVYLAMGEQENAKKDFETGSKLLEKEDSQL